MLSETELAKQLAQLLADATDMALKLCSKYLDDDCIGRIIEILESELDERSG